MQGADLEDEPKIMLAKPPLQSGRRARRSKRYMSNLGIASWPAPKRWHTDDVAMQKPAAMASRTALSMRSQLLSAHPKQAPGANLVPRPTTV